MSQSSATNRLVDEALRMWQHTMVVFRDGASGRRARLVGGPDVWGVIRAVRSARAAEPEMDADAILEPSRSEGLRMLRMDLTIHPARNSTSDMRFSHSLCVLPGR